LSAASSRLTPLDRLWSESAVRKLGMPHPVVSGNSRWDS
jgi:hypothetical protein